MAKVQKLTQKEKTFRRALIEQMLKLATSGFGLVAALAWNDVVKNIIDGYIKPYVGKDSGLASQVLYAIIITTLAVTITYYLTKLIKRN